MYAYLCVHMGAGTHGCRKRLSEPLELELQTYFVSYLTVMLGTELLWKSNTCSELLSHSSAPLRISFVNYT